MNSYKYEVSVVILTYHPDLGRTFQTIKSVLSQKAVDVELVVSDDGSEENYFFQIEEYLQRHNFKNYILLHGEKNQGTVKNALKGIRAASGEYIKLLSPGDFLYDDDTLRNWIDFLREKRAKWSFGNAVNYTADKALEGKKIVSRPHNAAIYLQNDMDKWRWEFCVVGNVVVGAAMLSEKEIILEYLLRIENSIVYTEDVIWRLMMFHNCIGYYYSRPVIYYEYGVGISTANQWRWRRIIFSEISSAQKIMENAMDPNDSFQRKMVKAYRRAYSKKVIPQFFVKGKLLYLIKMVFCNKKGLIYLERKEGGK